MQTRLVSTSIPDLLPMRGRSDGPHVSTIISDICTSLGYYESRDEPNQTQLQLGCALEHAIVEQYIAEYPDRYIRGYEICHDGIFMTCDMLEVGKSGDLIVHEIKLPWMSAKHSIDSTKLWRLHAQLKSYCHGWRVLRGVLHIVYINGDYSGSGPIYREWCIDYTEREIIQNWQLMLTHGRRMGYDI